MFQELLVGVKDKHLQCVRMPFFDINLAVSLETASDNPQVLLETHLISQTTALRKARVNLQHEKNTLKSVQNRP